MVGDWRLPTPSEWEAFVSPVYDDPALVNTLGNAQWSDGDAFIGVESQPYWSGEMYDSANGILVNMLLGNLNAAPLGTALYIWPVRVDDPADGVCDGTADDPDCAGLLLCQIADSYLSNSCSLNLFVTACDDPDQACTAQCLMDAECDDIFSLNTQVPNPALLQCLDSCGSTNFIVRPNTPPILDGPTNPSADPAPTFLLWPDDLPPGAPVDFQCSEDMGFSWVGCGNDSGGATIYVARHIGKWTDLHFVS